MFTRKLKKLLSLMILSVCVTFIASCASTSVLPQIKLPPRPVLEEFTDKEFDAIPISAHEKILDYINEVVGWMEKAEALPCVQK